MSNIQTIIEAVFEDKITHLNQEIEAKDYFGCDFTISNLKIKYRKAKITPIKSGAFVALWKRNSIGKTIPFEVSDSFDFYIFEIEDACQKGLFVFPKLVLEKHNILSAEKEGKRGFRLYPTWCESLNKQAIKTQFWQLPFFVILTQDKQKNIQQLKEKFDLN